VDCRICFFAMQAPLAVKSALRRTATLGACGSCSMLARSSLTMQMEEAEKRRRQASRLALWAQRRWPGTSKRGKVASKVARNKLIGHGRERVQAASKTWHPRERNVVVVAVGYRCRIRSREHRSKQPQRARALIIRTPLPTNAKIGAFKHVARCPRSLPLLCYRFRRTSPATPTKPRIQARHGKDTAVAHEQEQRTRPAAPSPTFAP